MKSSATVSLTDQIASLRRQYEKQYELEREIGRLNDLGVLPVRHVHHLTIAAGLAAPFGGCLVVQEELQSPTTLRDSLDHQRRFDGEPGEPIPCSQMVKVGADPWMWYRMYHWGQPVHQEAPHWARWEAPADTRLAGVLSAAAWVSTRLKTSDKPRLERELIHEHGDSARGLDNELLAEMSVLLSECSSLDDAALQAPQWPATAANAIARRLYVNRAKTVQFSISTEDSRLARNDDLLREWFEEAEHRESRGLILSAPLSPSERGVILLKLNNPNLQRHEIAALLGIRETAVKDRLKAAFARLREFAPLRELASD